MVFILNTENSIANAFLAELRDAKIQTDRMRFRRNLERMGEVLAYEISKKLQYRPVNVETPLGESTIQMPSDRIVLASVLRAGLPLHQGFLNYFDAADNAFIAAYRRHHKDGTFEIQLDYASTPDLDDCVLILCDPMLATGASLDIALNSLYRFGKPRTIHVATVVASTIGVEHIRRLHPSVRLWIGALDEELTAKSYIVPGLGDAGDLAFGEKV